MSDLVRVLRIIEYVGPREKVEDAIERSIKGTFRSLNGLTIRAATLGQYPEMLERKEGEEDETQG